MPSFDDLRDELDDLRNNGSSVNGAFNKLVNKYDHIAEKIESLVILQEQLEREGHRITWP